MGIVNNTEKATSVNDSFRSSLEDIVAISEKLSPVCDSISDLVEMCKLALTNDGQLNLIMNLVTKKS